MQRHVVPSISRSFFMGASVRTALRTKAACRSRLSLSHAIRKRFGPIQCRALSDTPPPNANGTSQQHNTESETGSNASGPPKKANDDGVESEEEEFYSLGPLRMRKVNANIPNFLTMARIAMALPVGYLFYVGEHQLAFYGFFVAGSFDFWDGYLARKWNQKTVRAREQDGIAALKSRVSLSVASTVL